MRIHPATLGAVVLLVHCTGTDTGNPVVPSDFEMVRSQLEREPNPDVAEAALERLGTDNRDFAFALYAQVASGNQDNLFFSPYSISEAIAMLYAGARGETESEIASALLFSLPQDELHPAFNATDHTLARRANEVSPRAPDGLAQDPPKPGDGLRLSVVNAAFIQRGLEFQAPYLDTLATSYDAGLYTTDFARDPTDAEARINEWFADQTEDRIQRVLPQGSLDSGTRLVLANAIYFKAFWQNRFQKENTSDEVFFAPTGEVPVSMMNGKHGLYAEGDGYQALALPYASTAVRMLFVLPEEGRFDEVEARFDRELIDDVRAALADPTDRPLRVSVPRFGFRAALDAGSSLRRLGMQAAFEPGQADFSGISQESDLHVSAVLHQAFIAIDEDGTEAGAGTAIVAGGGTAPPPIVVRLDRPFLFLIYDEPTGQILFVGRLIDPRMN